MIAPDFAARLEALTYPDRRNYKDLNAHLEPMRVYWAEEKAIEEGFAAALAEEYLGEISESRRVAIAERTYKLAYEHGHSSGYSEIENYYIDFADFALAVYSAATS